MDLRNLASDLDRLSAADAVVVDAYLRHVFKMTSVRAIGGLFAVIGLIELELASYSALSQAVGPIPALTISGVINVAIALAVWTLISFARPSRDLALTLDIRKSAVEAIERDLTPAEGRGMNYVSNPPYALSEAMISSVATPLVIALIRSLISFLGTNRPGAAAQIAETATLPKNE